MRAGELYRPAVTGEHTVEGEGVAPVVRHLVEQLAGPGETAGGDERVKVQVVPGMVAGQKPFFSVRTSGGISSPRLPPPVSRLWPIQGTASHRAP
jgi:hypothetical protein